jgi:hypothetical protein
MRRDMSSIMAIREECLAVAAALNARPRKTSAGVHLPPAEALERFFCYTYKAPALRRPIESALHSSVAMTRPRLGLLLGRLSEELRSFWRGGAREEAGRCCSPQIWPGATSSYPLFGNSLPPCGV